MRRGLVGAILASIALCCVTETTAPYAHADAVAYLVTVTVRPGYDFASADDALAYAHFICDAVAQARAYPQIMSDVKADFQTADEYQASYLITQAVSELCPSSIWQLRNSAAGYRPPTP
jgi:hypothetical protein